MEIDAIRQKVKEGQYEISFTHTEKLRRRKIEIEAIEQAIENGEVIESYPDDPRGPSCLILGFVGGRRPIHIVCGNVDEPLMLIITAYEPDPSEWESNWRTRKERR